MFLGVTVDGSLAVLNGTSLEIVTRFSPDNSKTGQRIHKAMFCSGLGTFCVCSEDARLHFLHLVKKTEELTAEIATASQASSMEKQVKGKQEWDLRDGFTRGRVRGENYPV